MIDMSTKSKADHAGNNYKEPNWVLLGIVTLLFLGSVAFISNYYSHEKFIFPSWWNHWVSSYSEVLLEKKEPVYTFALEGGDALKIIVSAHKAHIEVKQGSLVIASQDKKVSEVFPTAQSWSHRIYKPNTMPKIYFYVKIPKNIDPRNGDISIDINCSETNFRGTGKYGQSGLSGKIEQVKYVAASGESTGDEHIVLPIFKKEFLAQCLVFDKGNAKQRLEAVEALEKTRDIRSVEVLFEVLKDKSPAVRKTALKALERMTGEKFGRKLAKWREWWENNKGEIVRKSYGNNNSL